MPNIDWEKIREQYPIFQKKTYLMTNGGGPLSVGSVNQATFLLEQIRDHGRVWDIFKEAYEDTRKLLAQTVNSDVDETCFLPNETWGINILALMFDKTFEIITFEDEFPSNILPWKHQSYQLHFIASDAQGFVDYKNLEKVLTPQTKILVVSHVEFATGFKHDLAYLGEFCQKNDLIFIVDATQSFGVSHIDFKHSYIDVLLYSVYKWPSAGYGLGCMHINKKLLQRYSPPILGWRSVNYQGYYNLNDYEFRQEASIFEIGHPNFQGVLLLKNALAEHLEIGIEHIQKRIEELTNYLIIQAENQGLEMVSSFPVQYRSGIMKIRTQEDKTQALAENNIICRSKNLEITVALSFYNNFEDIDRLVKVLQ